MDGLVEQIERQTQSAAVDWVAGLAGLIAKAIATYGPLDEGVEAHVTAVVRRELGAENEEDYN